MKRYSFFILLGIFLLFMFMGKYFHKEVAEDVSKYDLEEIKNRGAINVVFAYNEDGMMISDTAQWGFAYEKAKLFAEANGLKMNAMLESNLSKQIDMLKSGECDIIARDIPVTKQMKEEVLFTNPISKDRMILVQRKKGGTEDASYYVFNQLDLIGKTVTLPMNSPSVVRIKNLSKEIGDSIYIEEKVNYDTELLIKLVSFGDIDYTISDLKLAKRMSKEYKNLDIHLPVGFTTMQAWAVRSESKELCEALNDFFNKEEE